MLKRKQLLGQCDSAIKIIFSLHSIFEEVHSDPFAKKYDLVPETGSPLFAQSNEEV